MTRLPSNIFQQTAPSYQVLLEAFRTLQDRIAQTIGGGWCPQSPFWDCSREGLKQAGGTRMLEVNFNTQLAMMSHQPPLLHNMFLCTYLLQHTFHTVNIFLPVKACREEHISCQIFATEGMGTGARYGHMAAGSMPQGVT